MRNEPLLCILRDNIFLGGLGRQTMTPGSIVQCRNREWVLLPSAEENLLLLRPLTEAHRRIRQAVSMKVRGLTVKPQFPSDLLGLLVLQPLVGTP